MNLYGLYRNAGLNSRAGQLPSNVGFAVVDANAVGVYNPIPEQFGSGTILNANTANPTMTMGLNGATISPNVDTPVRTRTITTNGSTSFLDFAVQPCVDAGPISIEVIFKTPATNPSGFQLFTRGQDGFGNGWSRQCIVYTSSIDAPLVLNNTYYGQSAGVTFLPSTWYYLADVWSSPLGIRTYVNGRTIKAARLVAGSLRSSTVGLRFLRAFTTYYVGQIAAVRISNVVRNDGFYESQAALFGLNGA